MKLRIEHVGLVGTTREVQFTSGLNVVVGDTTTGKTSLMRLLRVLLGSDYDGIIPELRYVSDLSGSLMIDDEQVAVVRRLSQSENAAVDVAAESFAARLPAMRPDREDQQTYGDWLIDRLGLPHLRVPTAPTRPAEAATTPVSIADYLRYCRLTQPQIDADLLGSSNFFTDYKRRVVFRIYFGTYDIRVAELQERLRAVEGELRSLRSGTTAFDQFLEGTVLGNRAQIEADLARTRSALEEILARQAALPREAQHLPAVTETRRKVRELDRGIADLDARREGESVGIEQMTELARQLRAQSVRLTKAVVAAGQLVDFDYRVCPRCGRELDAERVDHEHCYLCLQVPLDQPTREDLLVEQTRVEAQIDEADELRARHQKSRDEIAAARADLRTRRRALSQRLDQLTSGFISDRAEEIAQLASRQARAEARIKQLEEYIQLLDKADAARARTEQLLAERTRVEVALAAAERTDYAAHRRVDHFEARLAEYVEALHLPRFETEAEPRSAIHRGTYQPIVNGRLLDHHSGGMNLLINIAYMLAIHQTAIELGLRIPRLLMIDGINKNLGRGEYDSERYRLIWNQLAELHAQPDLDLQIIVATNDIPSFIDELDVVRLRLSESDRLVPLPETLDQDIGGSAASQETDEGRGTDPDAFSE